MPPNRETVRGDPEVLRRSHHVAVRTATSTRIATAKRASFSPRRPFSSRAPVGTSTTTAKVRKLPKKDGGESKDSKTKSDKDSKSDSNSSKVRQQEERLVFIEDEESPSLIDPTLESPTSVLLHVVQDLLQHVLGSLVRHDDARAGLVCTRGSFQARPDLPRTSASIVLAARASRPVLSCGLRRWLAA